MASADPIVAAANIFKGQPLDWRGKQIQLSLAVGLRSLETHIVTLSMPWDRAGILTSLTVTIMALPNPAIDNVMDRPVRMYGEYRELFLSDLVEQIVGIYGRDIGRLRGQLHAAAEPLLRAGQQLPGTAMLMDPDSTPGVPIAFIDVLGEKAIFDGLECVDEGLYRVKFRF
jgi:hypothetical protein